MLITANNIDTKIRIMMELNKDLAEFELLLKLFMQYLEIDIYNKKGLMEDFGKSYEDPTGNKLLYKLSKKMENLPEDSELKLFFNSKKSDIKGFLLLRNSFLHGNIKQSFVEFDSHSGHNRKTISKVPNYSFKRIGASAVPVDSDTKCIRDLIVCFINTEAISERKSELCKMNAEIKEFLSNYLGSTEFYNL